MTQSSTHICHDKKCKPEEVLIMSASRRISHHKKRFVAAVLMMLSFMVAMASGWMLWTDTKFIVFDVVGWLAFVGILASIWLAYRELKSVNKISDDRDDTLDGLI